MKVVTISKNALDPITLPGMGRSIELAGLSENENFGIRSAFARQELYLEFTEEPGIHIQVKQLWANPHGPQITLFV